MCTKMAKSSLHTCMRTIRTHSDFDCSKIRTFALHVRTAAGAEHATNARVTCASILDPQAVHTVSRSYEDMRSFGSECAYKHHL